VADGGVSIDAISDRDVSIDERSSDGQVDPADAPVPRIGTCADPAPPGAPAPAPLPAYSGGTCPNLVAGRNTISTESGTREFLLLLPSDGVRASERLPVVFLWHWLGGSANDFRDRANVQAAVDRNRFIAVIPDAKQDLDFKWPIATADTGCVLDLRCDCDCRLEQELRFFDDMLACVGSQLPIDRSCVSSAGVSAGALWTAQLGPRRSTHLSSIQVLSGGVGDGTGSVIARQVRPWTPAQHKLPALVLWGGPRDFCIILFEKTSQTLETALTADNHFVLECVHNCAHSVPPFDQPGVDQFEMMWRFALDHPYWLPEAESPYQGLGLPAGTPDWCAIGAGQATIREGECPGTDPFLGQCT
jgi:hypothetical protein